MKLLPRSIIGKIFLVLFILLLIAAAFPYIWANRMYNKAIQNAIAQGVEFDIRKLAPPEIPNRENAWIILDRVITMMEQDIRPFQAESFEQIEQLLDMAISG